MTPTFPEQPLGQGAKWTVHEGIEQGGIHVNQLTTMEIVKLEGNRVELSVNLRQTAARQQFQTPGLALTQKLNLLSAKADGSLAWDLTELAPRAADLSANVLKAAEQPPKNPNKPTEKVEVIINAQRALKITEK